MDSLVLALCETYCLEELEQKQRALTEELLGGVTVTSVGFEGGSGNAVANMGIRERLELVGKAIEVKKGESSGGMETVRDYSSGCSMRT